jgi:hypothetical protein
MELLYAQVESERQVLQALIFAAERIAHQPPQALVWLPKCR